MLKNSYNIIDESLTNFYESEKISNTSNISFLKQWTCDLSCLLSVHVPLQIEASKIPKAENQWWNQLKIHQGTILQRSLYKFYNRAPLSIKFLTISVLKLPKYNILKICLKHAAFIDDFYQFYCIRSWWWCGCWEGKDEGEATLFGPKLKLLHFSVKLITRLDIICIIGLGLYRLSINISIYV